MELYKKKQALIITFSVKDLYSYDFKSIFNLYPLSLMCLRLFKSDRAKTKFKCKFLLYSFRATRLSSDLLLAFKYIIWILTNQIKCQKRRLKQNDLDSIEIRLKQSTSALIFHRTQSQTLRHSCLLAQQEPIYSR